MMWLPSDIRYSNSLDCGNYSIRSLQRDGGWYLSFHSPLGAVETVTGVSASFSWSHIFLQVGCSENKAERWQRTDSFCSHSKLSHLTESASVTKLVLLVSSWLFCLTPWFSAQVESPQKNQRDYYCQENLRPRWMGSCLRGKKSVSQYVLQVLPSVWGHSTRLRSHASLFC